MSSEIANWCCIIKLIVHPDPLHFYPSILNESWLYFVSSISLIFVFLNTIFSKSNHVSANILFLKSSSFFVNSVGKFYRNLDSLDFNFNCSEHFLKSFCFHKIE